MQFIEKPLYFLIDVVRTLDRDTRSALALIFMGGGSIKSPIRLTAKALKAVELVGGTKSGVRDALNNMNGSLVKLSQIGGPSRWIFKHPTIGDAFASIIAEDPELLDIYVTGTRIDKLIYEVTCGNVGLEGAKVIIPKSRYNILLIRLNELKNYYAIYTFLAYRCDKIFISMYIQRNPDLFKDISSPKFFLPHSEVSLLARLHDLNLLPEEYRLRFVDSAEKIAIDTPDADFLMQKYRNLFKETEIKRILESIRNKLLPNISSCITEWEHNYDHDGDPAEYFSPLKEALETFREEFFLAEDEEAEKLIDKALDEIDERIDYLMRSYNNNEEKPTYDNYDFSSPKSILTSKERSIFDDIDE